MTILYLLELFSAWVEGEPVAVETGWHFLFAAAIIGQLTVMLMKQETGFFHVAGR